MSRLDRTNAVHHVYRCFDADGRLVYVGSSANLFGRMKQHERSSWWAGQVVRVTAKVYPTGTIAREFERKAIRDEAPRWNKAGRGSTRHSWTQEQYDDWLYMLIQRGERAPDIRAFVNLYVRQWACEPPREHLETLAYLEVEWENFRAETEARVADWKRRSAEIQREDELSLRRERKARKKARAKKRAKKAARNSVLR